MADNAASIKSAKLYILGSTKLIKYICTIGVVNQNIKFENA